MLSSVTSLDWKEVIQIPRPARKLPAVRARNEVLAFRNAAIKRAHDLGFRQTDIADIFGIRQPLVSLIVRNPASHRAA